MADFDYASVVLDAQQLIHEFGRDVTFVLSSRSPADAAKPWRAPTTPPTRFEDIRAAIVPTDIDDGPASLVREPKRAICYLAAGVITDFPTGFSEEDLDAVEDSDGTRWSIKKCQKIAPGPLSVVFIMELGS